MSIHIVLIGLNHTTAPLALRERLAIGDSALSDALAHFDQSSRHNSHPVSEVIILSTCNRLEVYAVSNGIIEGYETLVQFLSQSRQLAAEEFSDTLYFKADMEAVGHLMRVACGLDSMIVGEPQILGQVTAAYGTALSQRATGPVLNTLFQHATRAGKRAHTETAIGQYAASVPSAAATLAERIMNGLEGRVVLVVGAGEMAEIAARALMERGASSIIVANRTYERGLALARRFNGEATTLERLAEALARADVVITATDAPDVVVTREKAAAAMAQRPERPMIILDIALPRDTEPIVACVPGIRLFDIDDMREAVSDNIEARQKETPSVDAIASEETEAFSRWFCTLDVVPTITDLRDRAEDIESQELEKALRRLRNLSERDRGVVRALAHGLVNKLLHEPTVRLKQRAIQGDSPRYAEVVRELFGLETASCPPQPKTRQE